MQYIGRTRKNIVHAANWREVHLPGVPNVKVDGYVQRLIKSSSAFGMGVFVCPNNTNPLVRLGKHCKTTTRKLKPGYKNAGYNVVSIFGLECKK
jgi:hypothetical protein